jgi:hypothetical protein
MNGPDTELLAAVTRVVAVFQTLGVEYLIGGSTASSVFGEPSELKLFFASAEDTVLAKLEWYRKVDASLKTVAGLAERAQSPVQFGGSWILAPLG